MIVRLLLVAGALVAACGGPPHVTARLHAGVEGSRLTVISRVVLSISGADFATRNLTLEPSGGGYELVVPGLLAGPARTFTATAFDAQGVPAYSGSTVLDLLPESSPFVPIVMKDTQPPPGYTSVAVHIDALTTSAQTLSAGSQVHLHAAASGGDGTSLQAAWSAAPDTGSFTAPGAFDTEWIAPAEGGVVQLTLSVTDASGSEDQAVVAISVQALPAAPDGLSVSAAPFMASLSWNAVSGAAAYEPAWSATVEGRKYSCPAVLAPATSAACRDLPSGAHAFFWVRAAVGGLPGDWSAPVAADIP